MKSWSFAAIIAATAILIAPLWCVATPVMPDFPARLAGLYLIGGGAKAWPLSQVYQIEWAFIPNLASEIVVVALAKIMPLATAAKLFLSFGVAMWVLGPAAIHRALYGRWSIAPLAAAFFAYNANFTWGFFNYYFAAGLSFLVFAAWLASEGWRRWARIAAFTVAATILYFCHVFAAALLLGLIVCFEANRFFLRRPFVWGVVLRRFLDVFVIFLPSAVAFFFLKPANDGGSALEFNIIDTALDRLRALIQHGYDHPAYNLLMVIAAVLVIGVWRRKIFIHPRMLFVVVALMLGALLAPEWALGGWGVDLRLPAVAAAFLFAAMDIRVTQGWAAVLGGAILLLLFQSAMALTGNWRVYDRQFNEFRSVMRGTPVGSRLMTVTDGQAIGGAAGQPYWHMAELAIIDRSDFTPLMFATPGQHVVRLRPPMEKYAATSAEQGSPPDVSELNDLAAGRTDRDPDIRDVFPYLLRYQCHFDGVILIHLGGKRQKVPENLQLRYAGSFFSLYDIRRPGECAGR